ncbi:MAG: hypothetical protein L0207_02650 [Chlamydiae bacterium]|nr:hypothetical protein [Chlamydiota bacterium]
MNLPDKKKFSLSSIVEQTAKILKNEVKNLTLKNRQIIPLSKTSFSYAHHIENLAKILREQSHKTKPKKKRKKSLY